MEYFHNKHGIVKALQDYPDIFCIRACPHKADIKYAKLLKTLSIFNAKKVNNYSDIGILKNVETLRICDSGNIQDINFILNMHNLKSLSFAGSNVVDGNLELVHIG